MSKTLSQVFDDIRAGKQKEICYTALICAMAERNCAVCKFTDTFKKFPFACCEWLRKKEEKND